MTVLDRPTDRIEDDGDTRSRLVIIGNGMAGIRTLEEILARGGAEKFHITVFGDEPYGNYNRIMLSHVLSGEEDEADIFLNALSWYAENDITLHTGTRVNKIDRYARLVYAEDGTSTPYDKLIIATGSRSFMPKMEGATRSDGTPREGVMGFRTIDDTRAMLALAKVHRRAVVIGGGLLGLEAARGLQSHGVQVDLVHAATHLMNQQIDEQGGLILRQSIEDLGITVHVKARTEAILGNGQITGVRLTDGTADPVRHGGGGGRHPAQRRAGHGQRSHRRAGDRRRRPDAHRR